MNLIEFKDYPSTETPLNAENLNHNFEVLYGKTLYENSSGSNEIIDLNESVANFSYLEIFYMNNNNNYENSLKIYNPNGKTFDLSMNYINSSNLVTIFAKVVVSGSQISFNLNDCGYMVNNNSGNSLNFDKVVYFKIKKVVGYK